MKRVFRTCSSFLLVVCVLLCSCRQLKEYEIIDDYSNYVSLFAQYVLDETDEEFSGSDGEDGESNLIESPSFTGLTCLNEYMFDDAVNFFGENAFVEFCGEEYLFDRAGKMTKIDKNHISTTTDIVLENAVFDKFLVKNKEKYGVLDINGETVLDFIYDEVEIYNNVIVGKSDGKFDVYSNNVILHSQIIASKIMILSDEFINVDGKILHLLDLSPVKIGEYHMTDYPSEGLVKIANTDGLFGFCSYPQGDLIISPQYFFAGQFSCGVSVVSCFKNTYEIDYPKIINKNNDVIFDNSEEFSRFGIDPVDVKIYPCFEKYCVYSTRKFNSLSFGVINVSGNAVEKFDIDFVPHENRVFNGYLIEKSMRKLYSLDERKFVNENYQIIDSVGDFFIVEVDNSIKLVKKDLTVVIDQCDEIEHYEDVLLVKIAGKYAYYMV